MRLDEPFDLDLYSAELEKARLELSFGAVVFNPKDHPRDLLGKFKAALDNMSVGDKIHVEGGPTVRKTHSGFRVGSEHLDSHTPTVAKVALLRSGAIDSHGAVDPSMPDRVPDWHNKSHYPPGATVPNGKPYQNRSHYPAGAKVPNGKPYQNRTHYATERQKAAHKAITSSDVQATMAENGIPTLPGMKSKKPDNWSRTQGAMATAGVPALIKTPDQPTPSDSKLQEIYDMPSQYDMFDALQSSLGAKDSEIQAVQAKVDAGSPLNGREQLVAMLTGSPADASQALGTYLHNRKR